MTQVQKQLERDLEDALTKISNARTAMLDLWSDCFLEGYSLKEHALEPEYVEPGDEDAPFFTEAFLYNLLGKENARTVLHHVRQVSRALGVESC